MVRVIAFILGWVLAASPASADIVRLKLSADTFGQGWMFLDQDGACKVVTAGHVVRGLDGTFRQPIVIDGRSREWTTGTPLIMSADPDIAVLPIPAAASPALCGEGRLSPTGVGRRVVNLSDGLIRTTGESEVRDVPVSRRASVIDSSGGAFFAVQPKVPGDVVRKGWSGSVVLDRDGPLGIVFEVDAQANEALAVRIDIIVGLLRSAPIMRLVPVGPRAPGPTMAVLAGSTLDPTRGPDQLLLAGGAPWGLVPQRRTIAFTLHYGAPVRISRLSLGGSRTDSNGIEALEVSTKADSDQDDWTLAAYCRAVPDAVTNDCRFLARTVTDVRVLVRTIADAPIGLDSLAVQ